MTRQGRGDDAPLLVKMILTPPSLLAWHSRKIRRRPWPRRRPKVYPFSLFLAWVEGLKKEELGKPNALCEQISFGSFIVPG